MKDLLFEAYEKLTDFIDNYQDGSGYHIEFRLNCHSCKETKRDRKLKKEIERNIYEINSCRKYRDGSPASSVIAGSPFGNYSEEKTFKILCNLIAIMNQYFPDYEYSFLTPLDFEIVESVSVMKSIVYKETNLIFNKDGAIFDKVWDAIDTQMDLEHCTIYSFAPEDKNVYPFKISPMKEIMYFIFNAEKKRITTFICMMHHQVCHFERVFEPRIPLSDEEDVVDDVYYEDEWREEEALQKKAERKAARDDDDGDEEDENEEMNARLLAMGHDMDSPYHFSDDE